MGENIVSPVVGCGRLPEDMTKFSDIWKQVIHYTSSNKFKFQFYEVESVYVTTHNKIDQIKVYPPLYDWITFSKKAIVM